MSTTTQDTALNGDSHASKSHSYANYLTVPKSWLFTKDHKRIGLMYLVAILSFFFIGGMLAMGIRYELLTPKADFFGPGTYNKVFTLHGAIMIFLFLIPSIPAAMGNFVLPLMLGAKDVAFPRLNLLSFHIYLFGAAFFIFSILNGGLDTGWTFYTPYSTQSSTAVISATLGAFILGFSSILTGLNFIVTIHKMRAPGMSWFKMPLFGWALYATSVIQLLSTPVLAITLLLLTFEKAFGIGIFDPAMGGDPILYQHFFWFYSHPAVYIMVLPGFGVISEVIAIHSRKRVFGYKYIAYSSVAIAIIGFLVWGHHMFVSGQSQFASLVFSFITFAVAIPTAIKIFSWVATLYKGSVAFTTPMVYALCFIFIFAIGGLTGLFLATLATDVHLHDTYFVVAHFHYVMVGGTLMAFLAGLHHWWPKMLGKMYSESLGRVAAIMIFIGFNVTFFVQFVMGSLGMPRRYHTYDRVTADLKATLTTYHQISSYGSFLLGIGLLLVLLCLVASLFNGKPATDNPWGGKTLEWETQTPPDEHNFHEQPVASIGPYEFDEIDYASEKGHA